MRSLRLWTCVLLLACASVVLLRRGEGDTVPVSVPLTQFPATIDGWTGEDSTIDPAVLDLMGKGSFLNRLYTVTNPGPAVAAAAPAASIALFVAYFATQRTGQTIHSPQNCLPGSGWTFEYSGTTTFTDDAGQAHQVGEYVISNGVSRDEVLYWYQSHGRTLAADYQAKFAMIADSIRYNRSDAALVRIITPRQPGETARQSHGRALAFARHLIPLLPPYLPS